MDWYTPPAVPPAPPPVSMLRAFIKGVIPPVLHLVFMSVIGFFMLVSILFNPAEGMDTTESLMDSPEYLGAVIAASVYSGLLSIAVFTVMYRRRKPPFIPERKRRDLIWMTAVAAIAGNLATASFIAMIQDLLNTDLPVSSIDGMFGNLDGGSMALLVLNVVLIAPIAEELCFRGLAFNRLLAAFPFWKANLIQAALFGIIHFSPIQSGYAFLFGLLLGWIYHRTGSFSAAVIAHIAFNFAPALTGFIPEAIQDRPVGLFFILGIPSAAVFCMTLTALSRRLRNN